MTHRAEIMDIGYRMSVERCTWDPFPWRCHLLVDQKVLKKGTARIKTPGYQKSQKRMDSLHEKLVHWCFKYVRRGHQFFRYGRKITIKFQHKADLDLFRTAWR